MKILHASPTYYSNHSIIGGGEKYIIYMILALVESAAKSGKSVQNTCLAFGEKTGRHILTGGIECQVISGRPWDPYSVILSELLEAFLEADVVVVHQCLSSLGLFLASHARFANKIVVGLDEGGGEHAIVSLTKEAGDMFDVFLAYSEFCASSFKDLRVPVKIIRGPVDTNYYTPRTNQPRDPSLILAVGRLLPHKGFDRIIRSMPCGLKLVIAGTRSDPDYFSYLMSLISSSSCEVRIEEGLSDDQVLTLMHSASVFVHASTHLDYNGVSYAKPELLGLAPLEALSCGTRAFVSTAGSLGELGCICGCSVFSSDVELTQLLKYFHNGNLPLTDPQEIYEDVVRYYGLAQFGEKLLDELNSLDCAR
jgi:glycosyltransferase involved in cell wall biosynthesis